MFNKKFNICNIFLFYTVQDQGAEFWRADFCPTYTERLAVCTDSFPGAKLWTGEESGQPSSRCFNTNDLRPYCLNTRCNAQERTLDIIVNGIVFASCAFEGQKIAAMGKMIECPSFGTICPE